MDRYLEKYMDRNLERKINIYLERLYIYNDRRILSVCIVVLAGIEIILLLCLGLV